MPSLRLPAILIGAAAVLWTARAHADPQDPPPAPSPPPPAPPAAPPPAPTADPQTVPIADPRTAPPAQPQDPLPVEPEEPPPAPSPRLRPPATSPASSSLARNDWAVGIDASTGPLPGLSQDSFGVSLAARFGYRFDTGRAFVVPEATLAFVEMAGTFPVEGTKGRAPFHIELLWIGAGGRAGVRLWRFEPALFAHGYIWFAGTVSRTDDPAQVGGGGGPALDAGGALDFRISPSVAIGAHVAGIFAHGRADFGFGIAGLHVDLMR